MELSFFSVKIKAFFIKKSPSTSLSGKAHYKNVTRNFLNCLPEVLTIGPMV